MKIEIIILLGMFSIILAKKISYPNCLRTRFQTICCSMLELNLFERDANNLSILKTGRTKLSKERLFEKIF